MACGTDSRVNHYDCSTDFSSSEQGKVSLRIKRRFSCRPAVNKKPLCGGNIIMRQNRIQAGKRRFWNNNQSRRFYVEV